MYVVADVSLETEQLVLVLYQLEFKTFDNIGGNLFQFLGPGFNLRCPFLLRKIKWAGLSQVEIDNPIHDKLLLY